MKGSTDLLAFCGLYCGDCGGYAGEIAEHGKLLISTLEKYKFSLTAKNMFSEQLGNYDEFYKKLKFISNLKCSQTCRERKTGSTTCEIRKCCMERGYFACYECDDFLSCNKLKTMEKLHKDSCLKNLSSIKKMGLENWIKNGKRLWFGSKSV